RIVGAIIDRRHYGAVHRCQHGLAPREKIFDSRRRAECELALARATDLRKVDTEDLRGYGHVLIHIGRVAALHDKPPTAERQLEILRLRGNANRKEERDEEVLHLRP